MAMSKKPVQPEVYFHVVDDDHLYIMSEASRKDSIPQIKSELQHQTDDPDETLHVEEVSTNQVMSMVCETPVESDFGLGSTFDSFDEFEEALKAYMEETHTVFTKFDSKTVERVNRERKVKALLDETKFKYAYIKYVCKHYGSVRHTRSNGTRPNQSTFKNNCPAYISAALDQTLNVMKVNKLEMTHNHPIGPEFDVLYPEKRRLTKEQEGQVVELILQGLSSREMLERLDFGSRLLRRDIDKIKRKYSLIRIQSSSKGKSSKKKRHKTDDLENHDYEAKDHMELSDNEDEPNVAAKKIKLENYSTINIGDVSEVVLQATESLRTPLEVSGAPTVITSTPSAPQSSAVTTKTTESPLTTQVQDINFGRPARNMPIEVWKQMQSSGTWAQIAVAKTNQEGKAPGLVSQEQFTQGIFKIFYNTEEYYKKQHINAFYPYIDVVFKVKSSRDPLHIAVQISPHGYSTSRGTS